VHPSLAGVPGAGDPQLTTEGIGRADVWVFDATALGVGMGGTPIEIVTFFGDTPRALATSPDGDTVYAAVFMSGNQTTVVGETVVNGNFPGPNDNGDGANAPDVGAIVKWNGASWQDADGVDWTSDVNLSLPDHDVFSIDANTLASNSVQAFDHVGTIIFNMAVNPTNGHIYATNTELPNHVLFEGPGAHGGSTVQGHLSESRITVIDPSAPSVSPKHLNQHIDYGQLHTDPGANHAAIDAQAQHSLATPVQPVVSSDGQKIYVPAFGSGRIGVFDTADIEDADFATHFDPTVASASYIDTSGGGPAGLVLDETHGRLYVLTRFQNQVEVIDTVSGSVLETHALHNPEPPSVIAGRPFLYDANISSGNGEASCSSCHIFGDLDGLAWNLGDPDASVSQNTNPVGPIGGAATLHPMKGPMTTQTLRGMATHGALHWRGDRVDGFFGIDDCNEPGSGAKCDEDFSFRNFIVAFEGLVGKHGTISTAEMQQYSDFILQVFLPPNPVRALDNSLNPAEAAGRNIFFNQTTDIVATCNGCHELDASRGFFGANGERTFENEPQEFKVAHMRNLYAKIGMFGQSTDSTHLGDQVRGFGFLHDGSVDTVKNFLENPVFSTNEAQELDLEAFSLAFPSDLAPIVGQQVTLTSSNAAAASPRIQLLIERAGTRYDSLMVGGDVPECDLIAKGSVAGQARGWFMQPNGTFNDDVGGNIIDAALRSLATTEGPITYTCAPPGSGQRMGIDRDLDSVLDGIDNCPATANPGQSDGDGDGLGDACDLSADSDGDGVLDGDDNCPGDSNATQDDFDGDDLGDVCDDDDDNDGLLDTVETDTNVFASASDTGSDPFDFDSDDDGWGDGAEVAGGSDPNDPLDFPTPVPLLPIWGQGALAFALTAAGWRGLRRRRRD
jgi:DNA-binding beta-propeller fold protein YncE